MGFRENLKSELEYSGMLVKELAANSGVSKSSLDNYLNIRGQLPSVESGVKIAKVLGVSVEYLVTGKDNSKCTIQTLSKTSRLIAQHAEYLDNKKKAFVLELVKWLQSQKDSDVFF